MQRSPAQSQTIPAASPLPPAYYHGALDDEKKIARRSFERDRASWTMQLNTLNLIRYPFNRRSFERDRASWTMQLNTLNLIRYPFNRRSFFGVYSKQRRSEFLGDVHNYQYKTERTARSVQEKKTHETVVFLSYRVASLLIPLRVSGASGLDSLVCESEKKSTKERRRNCDIAK